MFTPPIYEPVTEIISWRRFTSDVVTTIFGTPEAELVQLFVVKASPRPLMPIAYIRVNYKYSAYPDPNAGQNPSTFPPFGQ